MGERRRNAKGSRPSTRCKSRRAAPRDDRPGAADRRKPRPGSRRTAGRSARLGRSMASRCRSRHRPGSPRRSLRRSGSRGERCRSATCWPRCTRCTRPRAAPRSGKRDAPGRCRCRPDPRCRAGRCTWWDCRKGWSRDSPRCCGSPRRIPSSQDSKAPRSRRGECRSRSTPYTLRPEGRRSGKRAASGRCRSPPGCRCRAGRSGW